MTTDNMNKHPFLIYKEAVNPKEVKQHIKTLRERGWEYLGRSGSNHHQMNWPHAPEGKGVLRFSATPADAHWLKNSQRDAANIEKRYPAPINPTTTTTENTPSDWDIRLQADQEAFNERSLAKQQENEKPLTVQEKMRQKREQLYRDKGL